MFERSKGPTKLIIFGPTGATGAAALKLAIDLGWKVTAFAKDPNKIEFPKRASIKVVHGDVLDARAVSAALPGHDVVLVALGGGSQLIVGNNVCSAGTGNIIDGMKEHSIKRIVVITAMGAGDSAKFVPQFRQWTLKNIIEDKTLQENHVKESGLEYVIVRPTITQLNNGPERPREDVAIVDSDKEATPSTSISRIGLARFALEQCTGESEWLGKAVGIGWK